MLKKILIGAWQLTSFDIIKNNISQPWRPNCSGMLIYSSTNHMSVSINSFVQQSSTTEEKMSSILFYSGTFEIDEDRMEVRHHVLNASNPERIGKEMLRSVILEEDGDAMQLVGKSGDIEFILCWKKIAPELSITNENTLYIKKSTPSLF